MEPKKKFINLFILCAGAVLLGFLHTILFWGQNIGLNFFLFVLFIILVGGVLNEQFHKKIDQGATILILPILFFALMVFVRSSMLLTFFNVLGCVLLLFIVARSYSGRKLVDFLPWDYLKVLFIPFSFIVPFFQTVLDFFVALFSFRKNKGANLHTKEIVRGTAMAVVAIIVFSLLFAGADATFSNFVQKLFAFDLTMDFAIFRRIIILLFVTAFFTGAFAYMYKKYENVANISKQKSRNTGAIEMKILLSSINVLFFIFIILQIAHLFGGGANMLERGITYAEYARKGFYELIFVAILSYIIIATAENNIVKNGESHLKSFKILSTVLVAQVVVILISAFMKLSLYESMYGFTTIRIYSHALMIWLAVVMVLLARHIFAGGTRAKFSLQVFICVILLLFGMNVLNPDAFIAKRNLVRYAISGKIDTEYLASLSSDAIPYTVQLLNSPDTNVQTQFANSLRCLIFKEQVYFEKGFYNVGHWQALKASDIQMQKVLLPYMDVIKNTKYNANNGSGERCPTEGWD